MLPGWNYLLEPVTKFLEIFEALLSCLSCSVIVSSILTLDTLDHALENTVPHLDPRITPRLSRPQEKEESKYSSQITWTQPMWETEEW